MPSINDSSIKIAKTINKSYSGFNIPRGVITSSVKLQEQINDITKIYKPVLQMQDQQRLIKIFSPLSEQLNRSRKLFQNLQNSFMLSNTLVQSLKTLDSSYKEMQKTWQQYDFVKLSKIIKNTISVYDNNTPFDANTITDKVVETYIADTAEVTETDKNMGVESRKEYIKNIRDWVGFWVGIIGFIISIYSAVSTKPSNTYNTIIEVNNYYVNELEISAQMLNAMSYRIVTRNDVMPRIKPDCSSRVIGHLKIGQIVVVSDKYKKWVKIDWEDENGNQYSGWIQNYKLAKFK